MTATSDTRARHGKRKADANDNITLEFGFLQGAIFQPVAGTCKLPFDEVYSICGLKIMLKRPWQWKLGMAWYPMRPTYLQVSCCILLVPLLLRLAPSQ